MHEVILLNTFLGYNIDWDIDVIVYNQDCSQIVILNVTAHLPCPQRWNCDVDDDLDRGDVCYWRADLPHITNQVSAHR